MQSSRSTGAANLQTLQPLAWSEALWLLIAVGTLFGATRVVGLAVANLWLGRYVQHGVNLLWTGPLGATMLVLVGGVLVWTAGAIVPALRRMPVFVFAAVWLAATSLALNITGIYVVAAATLGAGVAAVAMRLARRDPELAKQWGRIVGVAGVSGTALAFITLVLAGPALESWRSSQAASPPADAPNVLLIVLDTVRAKSLGAYGNTRGTSPFLDALGHSGVRFAQAFAPAPWTTPTHASLMTGLWPTELHLDWNRTLDDREPTVAEVLRRAGYLTAGFVGNPGKAGRSSGIGRGFTHFEDYSISFWSVLRGSRIGDRIASSAWLRRATGRESIPDRKRSPQVTAEFMDWLDRQQDRPFFVFLNYFDAHHPYEAPPEFEARFGVAGNHNSDAHEPVERMTSDDPRADLALRRYEAAIAYQDDQLRLLFAGLDRRGKLANTLVVVTSDHGEEFGEHGAIRHGNSVYRAAVHVPLIMSFPNRIPNGRVVTTPVSLRSVAATLTHMVPGLPAGLFRGPSLFDVMTDAATAEPVLSSLDGVPQQPSWFPVHYGPLYALLDKGYRYIVNAEGAEELYRVSDADERTNLASHPESKDILNHMRTRLTGILTSDTGRGRRQEQ
jgi:arylsulfatase A-like enzyme